MEGDKDMSTVTQMPARGAGETTRPSELGKPTEGVIPKHNGKITREELSQTFDPFEGDEVNWLKRGLPTPGTPIELFPTGPTCTPSQAFERLGVDKEKLAVRRHQIAAFIMNEEGAKEVPNGGQAGLWFLYWEKTEVKLGFVYRSSPDDVGFLAMDYGNDEPLPEHEGHKIAVPKKR